MNNERAFGTSNSLSELPGVVWRRGFWCGIGLGMVLGIALTIAIGVSVISSCQGSGALCPAWAAHLSNNR